jgi:hypothetical protein
MASTWSQGNWNLGSWNDAASGAATFQVNVLQASMGSCIR